MTKTIKLIFGGGLFALMGLYWDAISWQEITKLAKISVCGLETTWQNNKVLIDQIKLENYSPVLHPGDEILGIKEFPKMSPTSLLSGTLRLAPGTEATFLVKCHGTVHEVPVMTQELPLSAQLRAVNNILVPWMFFLTGLIVLLLKADEFQAWLLAILLGAFVGLFGGDTSNISTWLGLLISVARSIGILSLPVVFHFFLVFPAPSPFLKRWPQLGRWLYLPFFIFVLPFYVLTRLGPLSNQLFHQTPAWVR